MQPCLSTRAPIRGLRRPFLANPFGAALRPCFRGGQFCLGRPFLFPPSEPLFRRMPGCCHRRPSQAWPYPVFGDIYPGLGWTCIGRPWLDQNRSRFWRRLSRCWLDQNRSRFWRHLSRPWLDQSHGRLVTPWPGVARPGGSAAPGALAVIGIAGSPGGLGPGQGGQLHAEKGSVFMRGRRRFSSLEARLRLHGAKSGPWCHQSCFWAFWALFWRFPNFGAPYSRMARLG